MTYPPSSSSKATALSARGNSRRAQVLAQDPDALKETGTSSLQLDTNVEYPVRREREVHSERDTDQDDDGDQDDDSDNSSSSWWLDPTIPASTTLNACFSLIHTSEKSALSIVSSIPHIFNAAYHLFILIPAAVFLAILSHVFLPRTLWQRGGAPRRLSWPIRRSHNWNLRETASVAVVSHLLPAFLSLSKTRFCPSAERLIPALSRRLFGVKHQGWTIEGVAIQLKEDQHCRIRLSDDGGGSASEQHSTTPLPTPVLLWKSHARNVQHHQITSFKPSISCGGIGGGQARSRHERILLLLSGSSYVDRDPIAGLMACNLVNLTGLRCLCVNWRRPSSNHPTDHKQRGFPAGLNDALQAYLHLTKVMKFRPENVILVGEGSGAGVAMGLMVWLSALQLQLESVPGKKRQQTYGKPGKVVLWTPWCDLTMQSPTWGQNGSFDIVSCRDATAARDAYVASLGLTEGSGHQKGNGGKGSPHKLTHGYMKRKQSSQGSDSGLEIDSRPGSPAYSSSPLASSLLTSPISTLVNATSGTDVAEEPHSVWSMGEGVDFLFGKDKSQIQQHYADKLTTSPSSAVDILMSSLPALGLEHPLLSPGLPCGRKTGVPPQPFNERVLELLHGPYAHDPRRSSTQTQFLIFCGRDSVVWGEAASLANNLSCVEPNGDTKNVTFLSSLDTPTMFNLLPSIFLPQAQARADEILKQWLLGDVRE